MTDLRSAPIHTLFTLVDKHIIDGVDIKKQGFYELLRKVLAWRKHITCLEQENTVGVLIDNHTQVYNQLCKQDKNVDTHKDKYWAYMQQLVNLVKRIDGSDEDSDSDDPDGDSHVSNECPASDKRKIEISVSPEIGDVKINVVKCGGNVKITFVF